MKQHINYSDFKSVEDEKFEELAKYWYREEYSDLECFADKSKGYWLRQRDKDKNFMYEFTKFFTIGKMIEILNNKHDWSISNLIIGPDSETQFTVSFDVGMHEFEFKDAELCDALWQAVKEVL